MKELKPLRFGVVFSVLFFVAIAFLSVTGYDVKHLIVVATGTIMVTIYTACYAVLIQFPKENNE